MRACIAVTLVLAGCHTMQWSVPPTPEGNACKRDCMVVYHSCVAGVYDTYGIVENRCRRAQDDCHSTCPGARRIKSSTPATTPLDTVDVGTWYVTVDGERQGPMHIENVRRLLGGAPSATVLNTEDNLGWVEASEHPLLEAKKEPEPPAEEPVTPP